MKRFTLVAFALVFVLSLIVLTGCKKAPPETALMENMESGEEMPLASPEEIPAAALNEIAAPAPVGKIEVSVPQVGKPTPQQIQTALKNAGLYTGLIDGKIGPKSKKAILDFQTVNNLTADGAVGKKTWAKLQEYLTGPKTIAPKQ